MQLEDYFDFLANDDIRIRGTRIGIETILGHYLKGISPETLADWYPNLSLDQIFATLTYYFANRDRIDRYLAEGDAWFDEQLKQQQKFPSPVIERLRQLKRQQQLEKVASRT